MTKKKYRDWTHKDGEIRVFYYISETKDYGFVSLSYYTEYIGDEEGNGTGKFNLNGEEKLLLQWLLWTHLETIERKEKLKRAGGIKLKKDYAIDEFKMVHAYFVELGQEKESSFLPA